MYYIVIVFYSAFFSLLIDKENSTLSKRILFVFFCILLGISLGVRYGVGYDYYNYENYFNLIKSFDIGYESSFGYYYINKLISEVSDEFVLVTITSAIVITFFALYRGLDKNLLRFHAFYFCIGGFLFFSNNQIKQAIVASVFCFSLKYIMERRLCAYILIIIAISLSFHLSGLLLILLYFTPKIRLNSFKVLFALFGSFFLVKYGDIYHHYLDLLQQVPVYGEKYSNRMSMIIQDISSGYSLIYISLVAFIIHLCSARINQRLVNIYIFGVFFYIVFINSEFMERFFFYIIYINFMIIPHIIEDYRINKEKKSLICIVLVTTLMLVNFSLEAFYGIGKHGALDPQIYFYKL